MIRRWIHLTLLLALAGPLAGADESLTNSTTAAETNASELALPAEVTPATTPGTPMSASRIALKPGTTQLRQGFQLLLAASEPDVINPVALAFDADGRLYVAEGGLNAGDGNIKRLEDLNGDGRFDRMTLFSGGVVSPTAIICYGTGVFVAVTNEVTYLADTDGDGKADSRRVIYSGFTTDQSRPSGGITHLVWGPDNQIHAACDGVTGTLKCEAIASVEPLAIAGHDFAFNPRTLEVTLEAGGDSLGLAYDLAGRRFTTSRRSPFKFTVADVLRTSRNPLHHWPALQTALTAADGRIYPLQATSQPAKADAPLLAFQEPTNRFSNPQSLLIYRGTAFPNEFANSLFVADPALRIISQWEIREAGIVPTVQRPPATRTVEFLASRDPAFRPTQIVASPDGSLYVADLGREKLEESAERGRIWRLQPESQPATRVPRLTALPDDALVKLLSSPNGWARDTASRLLFERNDAEAFRTATKELRWNWNPQTKLPLLQLLAAGGALDEPTLLRALQDKDANVRATATALAAQFISSSAPSPALLGQLGVACRDNSPRIRLEAALTLGGVNHRAVPTMLASAIRPAPADPWIQSAVLTSAHTEGAGAVLGQLAGNTVVYRDPGGWAFLRRLAWMAGTESNPNLAGVLANLSNSGIRFDDQLVLAHDLGEGLLATGRRFVAGSTTNESRSFGRRALSMALAGTQAASRADAIRFLGVSGYSMKEAGDWILVMLAPGEPEAVQLAAVDALAHFPDPRITDAFVQRWPRMNPTVQAAIITRLLEQFDRTHALMAALENGTIRPAALTDVQVNFLRDHRDQTIAARATRLYGTRAEMDISRLADAIPNEGTPNRGRRIFEQRCVNCHAYAGQGGQLGPDLLTISRRTRQELLADIFNPSATVAARYQTKVVQRTSNQLLIGLVQNVGSGFIRLDQADGQQLFLPSSQIEDTFEQDWSLMPASAAAGLSAGDLADLLAFLQSSP